ncbi:phenylacetaldehyde oxime monooxygenase CYP71AN24-like [Prosopis cineraria]|uniref:phenylacetaldehyde oxime monooxygenase CYP71AN24-like n=1 Tax=Prosopis cineraria TaxID=364024 RepID=UPI00240FF68A|nr:phenylacetaldehyde oxime monooxygenase CYP71AN24-like [Prosopis cineraria]
MALLSLVKHYFPSFQLNGPLLSLSCFIIVVLFLINLRNRPSQSKSNLKLPPSPPKLPIIGNLHQLGSLPHHSFRTLSKKYGPLMFLQLGQTPAVVVSSAELACEFMKIHDLTIADRPQGICPKILLYGCTDVGFGSYGSEDWRQKRKICVNELLSLRRVQSFKNAREEESWELVNKIRGMCLSGADSVNLSELLIATSNNIVCKCVLGDKFNTEANTRIGGLARKVMINLMAFSVGDYFPSFGWVDILTGLILRLKAIFKELDDFFDRIVEERRTMLMKRSDDQSSNRKCLLDILLQLQDDGIPDHSFSQYDIKSILMDMFVGGSDTSSTAMEWAMAELGMNPTKMQKAQQEVRRVVGNKSKVEEQDINQMNYLKCVVKEVLRLHPPTALIPPRLSRSRLDMRGYTIPAKTTVYINAWAIQRDADFWEKPEEFIPERFEKNDVEFKGQDFNFIPFGSGRRGCPGMMFGVAAVESVLANLLYWFDWKLPDGNGITVQHIDMKETFGLTVSKKMPLHLKPMPYSKGSELAS